MTDAPAPRRHVVRSFVRRRDLVAYVLGILQRGGEIHELAVSAVPRELPRRAEDEPRRRKRKKAGRPRGKRNPGETEEARKKRLARDASKRYRDRARKRKEST